MDYAIFINPERAACVGRRMVGLNRSLEYYEVRLVKGLNVGYVVEFFDEINEYHHTLSEKEVRDV